MFWQNPQILEPTLYAIITSLHIIIGAPGPAMLGMDGTDSPHCLKAQDYFWNSEEK